LGITVLCDLCVSTSVTLHRSPHPAFESDARTAIRGYRSHGNQLLDDVAGAGEAAGLEELELSLEPAAEAELSEGFDASLPDLASLLPLEAGFAEE
jgi:hypothetical protein